MILATNCNRCEETDSYMVEHQDSTIYFQSHVITDNGKVKITVNFGRDMVEPWPANINTVRIQVDVSHTETLFCRSFDGEWHRKDGDNFLVFETCYDDENSTLTEFTKNGEYDLYAYALYVEIVD